MIDVRSLTKRYGSTVAVDGLFFEVRGGRVTGFAVCCAWIAAALLTAAALLHHRDA
ncbi:hypothetical protein ACFFMN_32055 [Planobispora siamensis]|uniref:ABC transporter n=1 Tax=Planobispora siamensis TaxID=936338 RepID=A0A8J3S9Z8_9ACTN|nr:hypothetical protein Psi01_15560 [Planobispora siamensis]